MPRNTEPKNKPAHIIRLGMIKAIIWANQVASETAVYSVQLIRIWRDGDGTWHETSSLSRDDLLLAAKVLDVAHSWIFRQALERANAVID
jgi:hypothetical protein